MIMTPEIKAWLHKAKLGVEINSKAKWPDTDLNWDTLTWTIGKKYIKVIRGSLEGKGGSAYCFIDTHGNIYMAAGWAKPAKGVRGTIDSVDPKYAEFYLEWFNDYLTQS